MAVRVEVDGVWVDPWGAYDTNLTPGSELLRTIDWKREELRVLVVASQRPIPPEVLDARLAELGWRALEQELGCSSIMRRLSRARQSE